MQNATVFNECGSFENESVSFPIMRPFSDVFKDRVNPTAEDEGSGTTNADTDRDEHLEISTLGVTPPTSTYARFAPRTEVTDSEGFTSQDAGHIARE